MSARAPHETVLLRSEPNALASGTVLWQGRDDAAEVDRFVCAGDGLLPSTRSRDVQQQWVQFWGRNHMGRVYGPRGSGSQASVRFRQSLRPGQSIEPADLILDSGFHPDRQELNVGANLSGVGPARGGVTRGSQGGPPM
jgi:hypothetical protein